MSREKFYRFAILVFIALLIAACAQEQAPQTETPATAQEPVAGPARTLSVMTHDSFAVSEQVVAAFEQENNVTVQFLESGDAGTALNKAILSRQNPLADVLYGVDNTFLSRALQEDIFEVYESPLLAEVPDEFELDPGHQALPVDYGDVCLNYDKAYFARENLAPPTGLEDLLKPEYEGLTIVQNAATSSPGLAFLLATIGRFGPDGFLDFWQDLRANDVLVVNDWETAYYTEFSAHGGGRPIVVSYASSPPAEVVFADPPIEEPPTATVTGNGSCFRQVEFVGILQGTANRDLAEKWVDFMLSSTFQEDLPLQMFVFPVNENTELPETFQQFAAVAESPAAVAPEEIAANREQWIQAWTEAVLR